MRSMLPKLSAALLTTALLCSTLIGPEGVAPLAQDPPGTAKPPVPAAPSKETATKDQPLAAFAFMTGRWIQVKGAPNRPEMLEETWSPATGDAMVGMFRWTKGTHTWMFELMSLEATKEGPKLNLRHFSRGLVPWKSEADPATGTLTWTLESQKANEAVFVNPKSEDVQRVTYRRKGAKLEVLLSGPSGHGMQFQFVKSD